MAVVQEQAVFKSDIHKCRDLADHVVHALHNKSIGYATACVVFDDYTVSHSMKAMTRVRRTKGRSTYVPTYKVDDETRIKDFNSFLSSSTTKDMLTLYLAQKIIENPTVPTTTVTRLGVLSSSTMSSINPDLQATHEEADTLLILCAAEVHKSGIPVHIYSPDTDVLVLALTSLYSWGTTRQ